VFVSTIEASDHESKGGALAVGCPACGVRIELAGVRGVASACLVGYWRAEDGPWWPRPK